MTTVKKSAAKKAAGKSNQATRDNSADHIIDVPVGGNGLVEGKPAKAKKLSTEDRLEALIAFLKKHGLHFDGAGIEE